MPDEKKSLDKERRYDDRCGGRRTGHRTCNLAEKTALTVAHITDVYIRDVEGIPTRFESCLKEVLKHGVDFFLNGGDAIHAADYEHVTREDMLSQIAIIITYLWMKSNLLGCKKSWNPYQGAGPYCSCRTTPYLGSPHCWWVVGMPMESA